MMGNGRPLGQKKTVRVLVALTILVWATQTLIHQWGYGAEIAPGATAAADGEQFVPAAADARAASLELKPEATVIGQEVRLKQICRWSDSDAAVFAPLGDLILFRLSAEHPYRAWSMDDLRQTLRDAGVNVAMIRFCGPIQCMVSRSDIQIDEGDALQQWIAAHDPKPNRANDDKSSKDEPVTQSATTAATPAIAVTAKAPAAQSDVKSLRQLLVEDLAQRLSIAPDSVQMRFSPGDEKTLNLSCPQFKFDIEPSRLYNLGSVAWDVTIYAGGTSQKTHIKADAFAWQQQVVLMHPVAYKQIIRPDDVVSRRTLVSRLDGDPLLSMDQVVGQQAAQALKPGTIFTARMVDAVPLVRMGQLVTVILSRGQVQVKTAGRAMENGTFGQTIRVRNEQTRDVYEAVVSGPQTTRLGGDPEAKEQG
jgi:flagella basal body P-ring formation protein FlgA